MQHCKVGTRSLSKRGKRGLVQQKWVGQVGGLCDEMAQRLSAAEKAACEAHSLLRREGRGGDEVACGQAITKGWGGPRPGAPIISKARKERKER